MDGPTTTRSAAVGRPRRLGVAVLILAGSALLAAGCSSGRVVTTDDAPLATKTSTSAPPAPAGPPTNDHLANAFDFRAEVEGRTNYYFTSPSKRWTCAIITRDRVGCQATTGSAIPIAGAPDAVPDARGEQSAPNAIELAREGDVQFSSLDAPGYSLDPGPATILPFGKVLIVGGFQCNVQEATGISCQSLLTGRGFTFSADGYTAQYSDLPL